MTGKFKSIFLAAALAVTSLSAYTPPAQAASVTVTSDGRLIYRNRDRDRSSYRQRHWDHRRDRYGMKYRKHQDCYVKKTKYRSHGRTVVKTVRICN